jgi:hypothetical protein
MNSSQINAISLLNVPSRKKALDPFHLIMNKICEIRLRTQKIHFIQYGEIKDRIPYFIELFLVVQEALKTRQKQVLFSRKSPI